MAKVCDGVGFVVQALTHRLQSLRPVLKPAYAARLHGTRPQYCPERDVVKKRGRWVPLTRRAFPGMFSKQHGRVPRTRRSFQHGRIRVEQEHIHELL
jgi:hypothetical protein